MTATLVNCLLAVYFGFVLKYFLFHRAQKRDRLPHNTDIQHLFRRVDLWLIVFVGRHEQQAVGLMVDLFQRSVILDQHGGHFTVVHVLLVADEDDIAVLDAEVDHAVAVADDGEVGVYALRQADHIGHPAVGKFRFPAGDPVVEEDLLCRDGERDDVVDMGVVGFVGKVLFLFLVPAH